MPASSRHPPPRQPFQPSPTPSPASHQETFQNEKLVGASVGSALLPKEPWRVGATHYSFQDTDTPSAFVSSQAQPLQSKLDARLA